MAEIMGIWVSGLNKIEASALSSRMGTKMLIGLADYFDITVHSLFL